MSTTPTYTKPEDEELGRKRKELASLESELADRELHIATLRAEQADLGNAIHELQFFIHQAPHNSPHLIYL
jgi:septal ring factor EnvC (AmiA/AmiB activator)